MREKDTIRGRLEQDPDFLNEVSQYAEDPDFVGLQTAEEWEARNTAKKESRPGKGREEHGKTLHIIENYITELESRQDVFVDDIISGTIKDTYMCLSRTDKATVYAKLRAIAKKHRFTKEFDRMFNAFEKDAKSKKNIAETDNFVSIESVRFVLNEIGADVRYNEISKDAEVDRGINTDLAEYSKGGLSNALAVFVRDKMRRDGYDGATTQNVRECLGCIADKNRYNPVQDYLKSGVWDGVDRLHEVYDILGVSNSVHRTYIYKWFVQCVALAFNDDDNPVSADGCLTLQGPQGCGKTRFFDVMTPKKEWFIEGHVLDPKDKDSVISALRAWITELGELDSTMKYEQAALRGFLTKQTDRVRMPYDRTDTVSPRRTSFCATVNPEQFLKDETGSRRFWVVPVTRIDKPKLFCLNKEWIQQFWFQIFDAYSNDKTSFRLSDDEMRSLQADNVAFEKAIPCEIELRDIMDFDLPVEEWRWLRTSDVTKILKNEYDRNFDAGQVGRAITKIMKPLIEPLLKKDNPPKLERVVHGSQSRLLPILLNSTSAH